MSGQQADETRLALTAHEPLVLDGPPALFLIEEGSVAVFHAEVRGGQPVGPRRLLSRASSGRALLRVPHEGEDGLRFVVVAVQGATLREVRGPEGSPSAAWSADAIDGWIDLVAPSPDEARRPKLVTTVEPGRVLDLDDGECVAAAPGSSTWCRVAEGRADWLGDASVHLGARRGWVPLPPGAWIRARGPAQIETAAVGDLKGRSTRTEGLSWLHARILDRLAEGERVRAQREFERLQSRERLDAQGLEGALQELASVLQTGSRRGVLAEPLLAAMSMVGERIGVTVRPAADSEGAGQRSDPVEAIARASRVRVRRVKLRGRWWRRDCGPLLAFAGERGERPLALLRGRWTGYEAHDPADGSIRRVDARLAQELGGEAVAMCRPLPEGALRLPDLVRFSLSRSYVDLVFALATGVVATLLGMITPQATAILMDQAIPDANQRLVLEIGAGLIAAALGITIFNLAQGIVLLRIGVRTESDSQAALWDRLLRLRSNFFRRFSTGDLQSRIMAVNQIAQEVSGRTLGAVFSSFLALLNLGLLYYYSARLSLLALALGGVVMLTTSGTGVLLRRDIRELMDREGRLFGLVIQLIGGVGKLRVAGASGRAFTRWLSDYAAQLGLWARILRRRQGLLLFNTVLPILSSIALFALSHALLSEGRASGQAGGLTLGSFLAFNVAYNTFLGGVTSLSNTLVGFLDLVAKGERTRPILEEVPEVDQSKADPGRLGGQVTVEGVGFRYREDGPWILSGVDLRAEPGEFIAVVGASGSGKSTLFRLLLGFETPMAGRVAFDGQDLAHLDVVAVRRQLGVVLQNGRLDAGSIYDNLAGGGILSLDEAWAAAEAAGMAEEIREMPMGMHTVLSVGGSNLSGGQRQRLLIARALAHRPRVLLFDEATSALDNRTQAVVSESLERLRVTRIVIAHRLSTIRNADRIYVLEAGRIAQAGAFRELMEDQGGLFARMMTRQMA